MAKSSESKTKSRPKPTKSPGAGRGARTPGTSKSRPGPRVPTLAEFFAAATGHALESAVVVGNTVYWLPAGAGAPEAVVEVTPRGTTTLLGAAVEGFEPPVDERDGQAPYPDADAVAEFVADRLRGVDLSTWRTAPMPATAPLRVAVQDLLTAYRDLDALYAARRASRLGPAPLSPGNAASRSTRIAAAAMARMASGIHARIQAAEARVEALATHEPSDFYFLELSTRAPGPMPASLRRRYDAWARASGVDSRKYRPNHAALIGAAGRPLPGAEPCPPWMEFNVVVNAIADELIADTSANSPAKKFLSGATALSVSPADIPAAWEKVGDAMRRAPTPEARRVLRALHGALQTLIGDDARNGVVSRPRLPQHRRGSWSVPHRVHDAFGGEADAFEAKLTSIQRITRLVGAVVPDAPNTYVASAASAGAMTARLRGYGGNITTAFRYLIDSGRVITIGGSDLKPGSPKAEREAREASSTAVKSWGDAKSRPSKRL